MFNMKKLFRKYMNQSFKPAYVCASHVDNSHIDVDAQQGHIDNGK